MNEDSYVAKVLPDSIKFYIPRTEGFMDVVKEIVSKYGSMSLIEFDGYFEGKFEPVKYTRLEVHTASVNEEEITKYANKIRMMLKQNSLAFEFNNRLFLVSKK
jgi:hypothetical protein